MKEALAGCARSSPGPDHIHYELIKKMARLDKKKSAALVYPILKPEKDLKRTYSYRPISLTSCFCKLMERIVNRRRVHVLEEKKLLPKQKSLYNRHA
jgi:hypothetical protein